jgi:hypothetical protein
MRTPFFPQLRARFAACGRRLRHVRQHSLHHLERLLGRYLPPGLLAQAEEGPNSRERVFTLRRTFWSFLYQVLHPGCSCRKVVRQIQAAWTLEGGPGTIDPNTSAYCQARLRLPLDLLQRLRHAIAAHAQRLLPETQRLWYGLCPKLIDGTTVSLPDTPQNQRTYPQSRTQKPGCGFPLLRLLGIFSLSSGVLLDYTKGNKHQSELSLWRKLMDQFQAGDLAVADRGFCGYAQIAWLLARGVHSVFRLHQSRCADLRRGQRLGPCDRLFTWPKPRQKPPYLPNTLWKRIPAQLSVRVLRFQLRVPGFRPESVTLVTTLSDPAAYPAQEVARLYARRWHIELWFRDIKTTLGMEVLRCRRPKMVHKELELFLIAYNLIRTLAAEAAALHDTALDRISFRGTVDATAEYSLVLAQARSQKRRRELVADLLWVIAADPVPQRPGRREPRALKRRLKCYPLLNRPRHCYRETPHRNKYRKRKPSNLRGLI